MFHRHHLRPRTGSRTRARALGTHERRTWMSHVRRTQEWWRRRRRWRRRASHHWSWWTHANWTHF